jgi:hypothetical protein
MQPALIAESARDRDLERSRADARSGEPSGIDLVAHGDSKAQLRFGGAVSAGKPLVEKNFRNARRQQRVLFRRRRDQVFSRRDGFE